MTRTLVMSLLMLAGPALAQDLDDLPEADMPEAEVPDLPDADEPEADDLEPDELEPDDLEPDEPPDADVFEGDDLLGDPEEAPRADGTDTAAIYRQQLQEVEGLEAEERLAAWESYLLLYPSTNFLEQISGYIAQAEGELYEGGIQTEVAGRVDNRGIPFPETAQLENINPASRIKAGFSWGVPDWIDLVGDFEYALLPQLSVHAGMRKRFSGWSLDLGPRVAPIKSRRAGLLVSIAPDLHINVDPAFLGLRPTVGVGKVLWKDKLFLQVQGSPEWELLQGFWAFRYQAGGAATFRASRQVALFVEGMLSSKHLGWAGGNFRFHTVAFGLRFYPAPKDSPRPNDIDVQMGAAVPLSYNYWTFYQNGAALAQGHLYLK